MRVFSVSLMNVCLTFKCVRKFEFIFFEPEISEQQCLHQALNLPLVSAGK